MARCCGRFWLSFTLYDMVGTPRLVGFDNLTSVVHDPVFVQALNATLFYIAGSTVLVTLVALLLALAVSQRVSGSRAYMSGMCRGTLLGF